MPTAKRNFDRALSREIIQRSEDVRWRPKFLQTLLETEGDVDRAANAAGILPAVAYEARLNDPDFEQSWEEMRRAVEERRSDKLEKAFYDRAVEGSPRNRYDKDGNLLEESRDYDTPAGVTLLKGYRPTKFRERVEHLGQKNEVTSVAELFRALADEQRASAQRLMAEKMAPQTAPAEKEALPALVVSKSDEGGNAN